VHLTFISSTSRSLKCKSHISFTVLKLNSDDVRFICLEAQTSVEKISSFKVFLLRKEAIHQESQTQIAARTKRGLKKTGPHYDYPRATFDADATKAVPEPY